MNFTADDFAGMRYKIYGEKKTVVSLYPEFRAYSEFLDKTVEVAIERDNGFEEPDDSGPEILTFDADAFTRFTIYYYSRNSPLERVTDMTERKRLAAGLAGLDQNRNYKKIESYLLKGFIPVLHEMAAAFFLIQNERKYELYVSGQEAFHQLTAKVREPINEHKLTDDKATKAYSLKKECFDDAAALSDNLDKYEGELFGGEANITKESVEKKKRKISLMEQNALST
jgi:hypothetical protein